MTGDSGTEVQSPVTARLSSVTTLANGYNVIIRNIGAGALTIDPAGGDTIDGQSGVTLDGADCHEGKCSR